MQDPTPAPNDGAPWRPLAHAAIDRYALAGGPPRLTFLRHGENATFAVDAGDERFALRLHRPGYQTAESVASELAWTQSLQTVGIHTPPAVVGLDGQAVQRIPTDEGERLAVLFRWEPGSPLDAADDEVLWRQLGEKMATVHEHGRRWTPPVGFQRRAWDADGMVGTAAHWGDPLALHDWDPAEAALIDAARDVVRERLAATGKGPDEYGLIHADLGFENVLSRPDGGTVLLDFDDGGYGWFLYDLAVSLFPLTRASPADAARARQAMVAGYRTVIPLPDEALRELPTFLMARRLVTLGWTFSRGDTTHAQTQRPWRLASAPAAAQAYLDWTRGA